ncbi:MAG: hypothetical protein ACYDDF_03630 [Thermoplasmatota archaeon]
MALALLAGVLLLPTVHAAGGDYFGIGYPSGVPSVDFGAVLRDEPVVREITVQSAGTGARNVTVNLSGDLAPWVTTDVGSAFVLPPNSTRTVHLTLRLPPDMPNGTWTGDATFTRQEPASARFGTSSGLELEEGAVAHLWANVTDSRRPDLVLSQIVVPDIDEGQPIVVRLHAANVGNVRARFNVSATVLDASGAHVASFENQSSFLLAGTSIDLCFTDAVRLLPAPYSIVVRADPMDAAASPNATFDGQFSVDDPLAAAKGSLLSVALVDPLSGEGKARVEPGEVPMARGAFRNDGPGRTTATLHIEVFRNGTLVAVAQSDPILVAPASNGSLDAFLPPENVTGRYLVRGYVSYGGQETTTKETVLLVGNPTETAATSAPPPEGSSASPAGSPGNVSSLSTTPGPDSIVTVVALGACAAIVRRRYHK